MARLSSPESALTKLENLYAKIDELYESVDLIRQIREKFDHSYHKADRRQEELREQIEQFRPLETACETVSLRLDEILTRADGELARMLSEFEGEKERVRTVLKSFGQEQDRLASRHARLDREAEQAAKEMTAGMAYLTEQTEAALEAVRHRSALMADEDRQRVKAELERLRLSADESREELYYLEDSLEAFKARIQTRLDHRTDALAEQQKIYQESATYEIHTRFAEEADKLGTRAEAEIETVISELARQKERVETALAFLGDEQEAVARRHAHIDGEMARISQALDALTESARARVDQSIEEGHAVIGQEVAHVASFIAESEKEIRSLKGDVKDFKDRMSANLTQELEALFKQQTDFQQTASQEIYTRLSDETRQLRLAAEKELQALVSEKKEITEMHQALEDTLVQVNRKINGKATFFTTQLNNLIVNSQRDVSRLTDAARQRIAEELEQLRNFSDDQKRELHGLRGQLQGFAGQIREKLGRDSETLFRQQADFRKSAGQKLKARLSEEAERVRTEIQSHVTTTLEDGLNRQERQSEEVQARIRRFDTHLSKMQTEVEAAIQKQIRKHSDTRKRVRQLSEAHSAHEKRLPGLEERIRALEEQLTEMQQKRGFFRFAKKES